MKIKLFRDPNGDPTCCANVKTGEFCRFLLTRRFGLVYACGLGRQRDLFDQEGGYIRPDAECEVWAMTWTEEDIDLVRSDLPASTVASRLRKSGRPRTEKAVAEKRKALRLDARIAGEVEYASWFPIRPMRKQMLRLDARPAWLDWSLTQS